MTSRRLGLFSTLVAAGVLGVGSVAWACVPGHDHMTPEEQVAHGAAGAAPAAPAPAPPPPTTAAPAPAPSASPTQAQPVAAPAPAAPSAPAAPVAGTATRAAATPVTAAPTRSAPAPRTPVTAAPAPAAAAQVPAAPAAADQPAAPAAAPLVTTAPEVLPVTPVTTGAGLWEATSVSQEPVSSSDGGGSSQRVLGYAVLGLGVALLLGAFVTALLGWRRSVGPPAVTD